MAEEPVAGADEVFDATTELALLDDGGTAVELALLLVAGATDEAFVLEGEELLLLIGCAPVPGA